jgi:hypothetical protein
MENMFSRFVYPLTFTCNAVIEVYFSLSENDEARELIKRQEDALYLL